MHTPQQTARRFQFRLRSLFVLTACSAAALAFWATYVEPRLEYVEEKGWSLAMHLHDAQRGLTLQAWLPFWPIAVGCVLVVTIVGVLVVCRRGKSSVKFGDATSQRHRIHSVSCD